VSVLPPPVTLRPFGEKVDPAHTALVLIDFQHDFCSPGGAMTATGRDPAPLRAALLTGSRLLAAARAAGVTVVHVHNHYNAPGNPYLSRAWLEQARRRWDGRYVEVPMCVPGSWGAQICPEVAPREGERVVIKHRFSAFAGTDLDLVLRSRRVSTLVVTGVITYVCVESTVRDAFFADYSVVVAADGVAGWNPDWHRTSLQIMDWGFAEVVPAARVLEAWGAPAAAPAEAPRAGVAAE
jgi:ureidoacrylate peracid hydrolase